MLKRIMETPLRVLIGYLFIGAIIFLTFRVGIDYAQTGGPVWQSILRVMRSPLGSGAPKPPPGSKTGTPSISYYTVLMGAFGNVESARALRTRLAADRISGRMLIQNERYFVVVGQYGSEGAARETLALVRKKGYNTARVVAPAGGP